MFGRVGTTCNRLIIWLGKEILTMSVFESWLRRYARRLDRMIGSIGSPHSKEGAEEGELEVSDGGSEEPP